MLIYLEIFLWKDAKIKYYVILVFCKKIKFTQLFLHMAYNSELIILIIFLYKW